MFFTYILKSVTSGKYYIGHTGDISQREIEHNTGQSRYTRRRGPWKVVRVEEFKTRAEAARRELEIKKRKSRRYIEKLLRGIDLKGEVG